MTTRQLLSSPWKGDRAAQLLDAATARYSLSVASLDRRWWDVENEAWRRADDLQALGHLTSATAGRS